MGLFLKYQRLDCRLECFIFRIRTALMHKHKSNEKKTHSVCFLLHFILLEASYLQVVSSSVLQNVCQSHLHFVYTSS